MEVNNSFHNKWRLGLLKFWIVTAVRENKAQNNVFLANESNKFQETHNNNDNTAEKALCLERNADGKWRKKTERDIEKKTVYVNIIGFLLLLLQIITVLHWIVQTWFSMWWLSFYSSMQMQIVCSNGHIYAHFPTS